MGPPNRAQVLYEYGCMQARQGETAAARERLNAALTIFQRLGAQPFIERTTRAIQELP